MRPINLFFFLPVSISFVRFFPIPLITIMHCRHRNKEIVTVSVKVINNYASKIMTNESKIYIDQGRGIAGAVHQ